MAGSDELELDLGAMRALAIAHDRSAAVLAACARMVEQRTDAAGKGATGAGATGYGPIARALAEWAQSTAATAAELAAMTDRIAETDEHTTAALRDVPALGNVPALGDVPVALGDVL
jgi:hypothetical protein